MSGLSRTPGKRVRVNSPPRVRIPPSPPVMFFGSSFQTAQSSKEPLATGLFCFCTGQAGLLFM
jgi:hypothetical protein